MPRIISRSTYKNFMKKYSLKLMTKKYNEYKYKYKTMQQMQKEIYEYETNNNDVKNGLYFYKI